MKAWSPGLQNKADRALDFLDLQLLHQLIQRGTADTQFGRHAGDIVLVTGQGL